MLLEKDTRWQCDQKVHQNSRPFAELKKMRRNAGLCDF